MNIKKSLLSTPLAKTLKYSEALLHYANLLKFPSTYIKDNKTVYCISPYKTGTTFLSSLYPKNISRHEPYQFLTLKLFENNFDLYFTKRLNALNLKLECSGYFSAYINELVKNEQTKTLNYVCILRTPSSWIESVLNYWYKLKYLRFDYINSLFWEKMTGADLIKYFITSKSDKEKITKSLGDFYLSYIEKSFQLKYVTYLPLHDLEKHVWKVDELIDEGHSFKNTFKRENTTKLIHYYNQQLDNKYFDLIKNIKL